MLEISTADVGSKEKQEPPAAIGLLQLQPHRPIDQLCKFESCRLKLELMSTEQQRNSFALLMQKEDRSDVANFYGRQIPDVSNELIFTYTDFEFQNGENADRAFRGGQETQSLKKIPFLIRRRSDHDILGLLILHSHSSGTPQAGLYVFAKHRRQGYGKECMIAAIQYVRDNIVAKDLLWRCFEDNTASCRFAESLAGKKKQIQSSQPSEPSAIYTFAL